MKTDVSLYTVAALFFGLLAPPLLADQPAVDQRSGAWGTGGNYQRLYKKGNSATVRGNVLSMEDLKLENGETGVQVRIDTGNGDLLVHLGPRWFVLDRDTLFTRGEPITIIGVKIQFENKPAMIASEISKGSEKLILRELATGEPSWTAPKK